MSKPKFDDLWKAFPFSDRPNGGTVQDVKSHIGGRVDANWIENTCAIRVSRALNYSGHPVPSDFKDKQGKNFAISGADGKWYAFRVRDMHAYLKQKLGKPDIVEMSKAKDAKVRSKFLNKKGMIVFNVTEWSNATGHITLWDGTKCADQCYFEEAVQVDLWIL